MRLRSRMVQLATTLLLLVAVLALLPTSSMAQTSGTVAGTVADKTGAVIPDAIVVLKNQQTGVSRQAPSNGAGIFVFALVTPGTNYVITVTARGFNVWRSQPFALRPGDSLNFTDIGMDVAVANQEVTVEATGEAAKVMNSGERSDVINYKEMKGMAVQGRDATELLRMLPGFSMANADVDNKASYDARVVTTGGSTGSFAANGTATGVSVVADGANITDVFSGKGTTQSLNIDMIEEIKVSSSFGAENARGPTVINAVGKSGSSEFHGSAYVHVRHTSLNANDWMDNHSGQSRPDGRYVYPGGTIGGPLAIPKLGLKKDKAFFFVGFEKYYQRFEGALLQTWVPTLAERAGDFSRASMDAQLCGPRPDGKMNPNAQFDMCQTFNYLPDGTNLITGTGNNISDAALNSIGKGAQISRGGQALVNFLPLPNANPFTNDDGFNYIKQVVQDQNGSELRSRIDYNINDNNKLFLNYNRQSQIRSQPVMWGGYTPTYSMQYPGDVTSGDLSHTFSMNYTRIFTPTLTNEVTLAASFLNQPNRMDHPETMDRFNSDNGYYYFGQFKNSGDYAMPALEDYSHLGYPNMLMPGGFYNGAVKLKKTVPSIADNLSWAHGTHLAKAGVYVEQGMVNGLPDSYYPQGKLTFNPWNYMWSSNASVGAFYVGCNNPAGDLRNNGSQYEGNCMNPVGLMYLGLPDVFEQSNFVPVVNVQYRTFAGYVSDSWKVNRRLTLEFGVRFEHIGAWSDRHGNGLATLDPKLYDEQCSGGLNRRDCTSQLPGITYHSIDNSISNSVVKLPAILVSPRGGMAWDIFGTGRTVLRGGWGLYRSQEEFQPYARAAATATGFKRSRLENKLTLDRIEANSPYTLDFDVWDINPKDTKRPVHYQYNFTINQRMPWNSTLEVAYVGSDHKNLSSGATNYANLNKMPVGYLFGVDLTKIPPFGVPGGAGDKADFLGDIDPPQLDWFRPYPYYTGVYELNHDLYSNYNSLQVSWNKTAGWVTYGANYTWSKTLGVAESYQTTLPDPFNLKNDYNPAPFDRSHVFNVHYLIDLGAKLKGIKFIGKAFDGLQISGISSIQSGVPLAVVQNYNFYFGGTSSLQSIPLDTNQVNHPTLQDCARFGLPSACWTDTQYLNNTLWLGTTDVMLMPKLLCDPTKGLSDRQYINADCFGMPALGQNGDYRMPYIHGPAYINHDLTVMKNFKMGEKKNLQFRLAGFNFLNHPLVSFNKSAQNNLSLTFQHLGAGEQMLPENRQNQDFGFATAKYGNRLVELSVKFEF